MLWTEDRIGTLKRMFADGEAFSVIGNELGISRNAAIGKARRLGLPARGQGVNPIVRKNRSPKNRRPTTLAGREAARARPKPAPVVALSPPPPAPILVAPPPRNLTVMELELDDCRWPITDHPPHLFCGNLRAPALRYCPFHARLAHARP
jgi:hypothetical protein